MPAEGQRESQQDHTIVIREPWRFSAFRAFQSTSLPLGDRCFKPVTCFVRISFVRAASALFSADAGDRERVHLNSLLRFLEMKRAGAGVGVGRGGWGSFSSTALHLKDDKKGKCALELRRRANLHAFVQSFIHPLVYEFIRLLNTLWGRVFIFPDRFGFFFFWNPDFSCVLTWVRASVSAPGKWDGGNPESFWD